MKQIIVPGIMKELPRILDFVTNLLVEDGCTPKTITQIRVATEEITVNIIRYAYTIKDGEVKVTYESNKENNKIIITFVDHGNPYNPLAKEDPDIKQSADNREIGGLGIFLVKKCIDDVYYEYKDGCNLLTIIKNIK